MPKLLYTAVVCAAVGAACAPAPAADALSWGGRTQRADASGRDAVSGSGGAGGPGGSGGSFNFDVARDQAGPADAAPDAAADLAADVRDAPREQAPYRSPLMGCHLDIDVTTDSTNWDYAPNHIAAIWIANGTGRFVKSVGVWAARRISHLPRWIAATSAAGVRQNRVDAVTGPTLFLHGRRTVAWNCTGVDRQRVAPGPYRVCFELNETNGESESECVDFTVGATAQTVTPPDVQVFTARTLSFYP
jgi:hypothetical protein